jgi:hypothetical protein
MLCELPSGSGFEGKIGKKRLAGWKNGGWLDFCGWLVVRYKPGLIYN